MYPKRVICCESCSLSALESDYGKCDTKHDVVDVGEVSFQGFESHKWRNIMD